MQFTHSHHKSTIKRKIKVWEDSFSIKSCHAKKWRPEFTSQYLYENPGAAAALQCLKNDDRHSCNTDSPIQ